MDKEKAINCIRDLIDVATNHGSAYVYQRNGGVAELENVLACLLSMPDPVIRCRECKHYCMPMMSCALHSGTMTRYDYCSDGEREG